MTDDEASPHDRIMSELRLLRRTQVHNSYAFRRTPTIAWLLGRGDFDVALAFFSALPRMQSKPINAALAAIGLGPDESSVEDRLNTFASQFNDESSRTIRRWVDDGFETIAQMIGDWADEEGTSSPLLVVTLSRDPQRVIADLTGIATDNAIMLEPQVRGPDGPVRLELRNSEPPVPPAALHGRAVLEVPGDDVDRWVVEIDWIGSQTAYYEVIVTDGGLLGRRLRVRATSKGCELEWHAPGVSALQLGF